MPATRPARPWHSQGEPEPCHVADSMPSTLLLRRTTEAHPDAKLPRPSALLLAFMLADADACRVSQETLRTQGFGVRDVARCCALVEAGLLSRRAVGRGA